MAFSVRTKVIVLLLINFIVSSHCDNDFSVSRSYATDNVKSDLLRGSGERIEDEEVPMPIKRIKDVEHKIVRDTDISIDKEDIIERYDESDIAGGPSKMSRETSFDAVTKYTTTEYSVTTTNVPEEIATAIKFENDDRDDYSYIGVEKTEKTDRDSIRRQDNRNVDNGESIERETVKRQDIPEKIDDVNEETATTPATETATDYTLSMIDNAVYKIRAQDIYNNTDVETKAEITSTQTTTKAIDDMEGLVPRIAEFDDELDITMQRSPKTESRESIPPMDRRTFEKPRPTPAISKSSTLKGWLEDSWLRPPAGILVPLRPMALTRALAVWNDLTALEGLNVSDIVIVGYDSNGVNWRSRHNLQGASPGSGNRAVSEALSKLLLKYQGVHSDTTSDGTMRALASAAKLVPYDSALFIVTDKGAGDPQRLPLALRALVEKRLKVYTIWTDPSHPSIESEAALQELRNVSSHTEGDVLPYSLQVMEMDGANPASELQWDPMEIVQSRRPRVNSHTDSDKFDTLLVRRGGGGATSLGVPVENGVTALRIFIEGAVEHAVLYPPNDGPQIDLYNKSSVVAFSPESRTESLTPRDVYLIFPGAKAVVDTLSVLPQSQSLSETPEATVGIWHLSVRCDTCDYRLAVFGRGQVHFQAKIDKKEMLKLRVTGPVASVRESLLVDEYGVELAKLPFSYQPIGIEDQEEPAEGPPAELIADVPLPSVKGTKMYAKIVGRDVRGEPFTRLSSLLNQPEVRMSRSAAIVFPDVISDLEQTELENSILYNSKLRYNDSNVLAYSRTAAQVVNQRGSILTAVQIGLSSRLYGSPGDNLQLHFEVINYRDFAVAYRFGAIGELRFLRGISPTSQTVSPGQTVNVIVTLGITTSAQPGARDLITFTAYRNNQEEVSISAYVYVMNPNEAITDVWSPEIRHNFQGTCLGRQGSDCAQHVWSANIIARDALGGLLRLSSSPIGLIYDSNFISGSREEVIATYRATCCAPRVVVTAVDTFGNANSYTVDISNYLNGATIAAVVLGVLLAIALIALVIFLIYLCVKKRKESRELPYTTSTRNLS